MSSPATTILILLFGINVIFIESRAQAPDRYAIVIDEIFADPAPSRGLPNAEFIELRNISTVAWNLRQWKITDGSSVATISTDYFLQPDSFVVICSSSTTSLFNAFGPVIGVSNFPSLNNEVDVISLYSREDKCIHAVNYQLAWFNNAIKSEGGWSLEMIDTRSPCAGEMNWKASNDPSGGTPARKNSVDAANPDDQSPALVRTYMIDSVTIRAVFDESLDSSNASNILRYQLNEASNKPAFATALAPLFNEVELKLNRSLEYGKVYQLLATDVKDCSNNVIGSLNKRPVGLPETADTMDIVINEILFNPKDDGVDYLECYNRSKKVLDVSNMYVANRNAAAVINSPKKFSEIPFFAFPGDHLVITENNRSIQRLYLTKHVEWLLQVNSFPSLPDDRGDIVILNQQGKIIDELKYDQDWHFPLLQNKEGVSLERINPNSKTQMRENWTSASSTSGYGTPTYQNSQFKVVIAQMGGISIDPAVFSPDNDGIDDICFIRYEIAEPNYVANVWIYDVQGRSVRKLYNSITLSQTGTLRWDGFGENFKILPVGIYIIYIEFFNLQGKMKKFKSPVTLARRF